MAKLALAFFVFVLVYFFYLHKNEESLEVEARGKRVQRSGEEEFPKEDDVRYWKYQYPDLDGSLIESWYARISSNWEKFPILRTRVGNCPESRGRKEGSPFLTLKQYLFERAKDFVSFKRYKGSKPVRIIKIKGDTLKFWLVNYPLLSPSQVKTDFEKNVKAYNDKTSIHSKGSSLAGFLNKRMLQMTRYKYYNRCLDSDKLLKCSSLSILGLTRANLAWWKEMYPLVPENKIEADFNKLQLKWNTFPLCPPNKYDYNPNVPKRRTVKTILKCKSFSSYAGILMHRQKQYPKHLYVYPDNALLTSPDYWQPSFTDIEPEQLKRFITSAVGKWDAGILSTYVKVGLSLDVETRVVRNRRTTLRSQINGRLLKVVRIRKKLAPYMVSLSRFQKQENQEKQVEYQFDLLKNSFETLPFEYYVYFVVGIPSACGVVPDNDFHTWFESVSGQACTHIYYYIGSANPNNSVGGRHFCLHMVVAGGSLYNLRDFGGGHQVLVIAEYQFSDPLPEGAQGKAFRKESFVQLLGFLRKNNVQPKTGQPEWKIFNQRFEIKPLLSYFLHPTNYENFDDLFNISLDPDNFPVFNSTIEPMDMNADDDSDSILNTFPLTAKRGQAFSPFEFWAKNYTDANCEQECEDDENMETDGIDEPATQLDENTIKESADFEFDPDEEMYFDPCSDAIYEPDDETDALDEEAEASCNEAEDFEKRDYTMPWHQVSKPLLPRLFKGTMTTEHLAAQQVLRNKFIDALDKGPYFYWIYYVFGIPYPFLRDHPIEEPSQLGDWLIQDDDGQQCKDLRYYIGTHAKKGVCTGIMKKKFYVGIGRKAYQGSIYRMREEGFLPFLIRNWKIANDTDAYYPKHLAMQSESLHQLKSSYRIYHFGHRGRWTLYNKKVEKLPMYQYFFADPDTGLERFKKLYLEADSPMEFPLINEQDEPQPSENDNNEIKENPDLFNFKFDGDYVSAVFPEKDFPNLPTDDQVESD